MASNAKSRQPVREKLAELFTAAMVGVGKPLANVTAYQVRDFEGKVPHLQVMSGGAQRKVLGIGTQRNDSVFSIIVMWFVPDVQAGWTSAQVENRLDEIETGVTNVIADNRGKRFNPTVPWDTIYQTSDPSKITRTTIGDSSYWVEFAEFTVEVKDA